MSIYQDKAKRATYHSSACGICVTHVVEVLWCQGFKKVMSEKGKRFGKDISGDTVVETPIKAMTKGKGKVPIVADDSVTEDEPVIPQKTSNVTAASATAKQVSKAPAVASLASSSGNKSVQPAPAPTRPKSKYFKHPEPPSPTKVTAKPVLNDRPSEDDPGKPQLK